MMKIYNNLIYSKYFYIIENHTIFPELPKMNICGHEGNRMQD